MSKWPVIQEQVTEYYILLPRYKKNYNPKGPTRKKGIKDGHSFWERFKECARPIYQVLAASLEIRDDKENEKENNHLSPANPSLPLDFNNFIPEGVQFVQSRLIGGSVHWEFQHKAQDCTNPEYANVRVTERTKIGFASMETYQCTGCRKCHVFHTSSLVKTNTVSKGKAFSRQQCKLNVSIPASLKLAGINCTQGINFFGEAVVQMPAESGFRKQIDNIDTAILNQAHQSVFFK
jgi:hypothetical protein